MIQLYVYQRIEKVLVELDPEVPALIAISVVKSVADKSDYGKIFRKSIVVGQLVFDHSIALSKSAAEKAIKTQEKLLAGIEIPPAKPRASWEEVVKNYKGQLTPLHRKLKDPTKFYVAMDAMPSRRQSHFFAENGETLTKDQITPFLSAASAGGDIPDVAYQLHSTDDVGIFAVYAPAPEEMEDKYTALAELIAVIEKTEAEARASAS